MSDQPVAETSTWQRTLSTNTHEVHVLGEIRNGNSTKRAAADPRLRPRGYRDWLYMSFHFY
jgi:hypothetical protein